MLLDSVANSVNLANTHRTPESQPCKQSSTLTLPFVFVNVEHNGKFQVDIDTVPGFHQLSRRKFDDMITYKMIYKGPRKQEV